MNQQDRKLLSQEINAGIKYLYFGLGLIVIITSILYSTLLSDSSYHGYIFTQHQLNANELNEKRSKLEQTLLKYKSQAYLETSKEVNNYEPAPNPAVVESRRNQLTKN